MYYVHIIQFASTEALKVVVVSFFTRGPRLWLPRYIFFRLSLNGPVIVIIYIVTRLLF